MKKLGASTKLTYLITGESLLNDATALVLFNMFFSRIATTNSRIEFSLQGIVIYFLQVVLISPLIGLAFGIGSVCCIGLLNRRMQKEDTIMQISVSLCCAYLSFFVAEFNLGVSGVLSCCTAGIVLSALAPPLIFEPESMHSVWSMIEWAGNTLIFMLAGLIIGEHCISFFSWINLGYLLLLYVLLFTVRAIVIGLSSPFLHLIGIDLNANEMAFMTWGGLRGAVSMTLALSLSNSIARNQTVLDPHSSDIVFFFIGGIVAMTLLFNATTCGFLLKWLHLIDLDHSAEKVVMLSYLKTRLRRKVDHLISELKREHSTLFQEEQLDVFCSLMSNSVDSLDSLAKRRRKEDRADLIPDTHTERPSDLWETSFGYHTRSTTTSFVQKVSSRDIEAAQPTDSTDEMTAPLKQKLSLRTGSNTPTTEYPFSRDICMKIRKVFLQVVHVSYWKQIKAGKLPRHSLAALILLGAQDKASEMNFLAKELMDWHIIFNSYKFIFSADDSGTEYDDIEDSASSRGTDFQSGETVVAVGNERSSNLDRLDAPLWSSRALRCYFCRNQFIRAKSLINAFLVSQMVHILLGFIEAHEFAQKNIPQYMSGTVEQVRVVDESKTLGEMESYFVCVYYCGIRELMCPCCGGNGVCSGPCSVETRADQFKATAGNCEEAICQSYLPHGRGCHRGVLERGLAEHQRS